MHKIQICDTFSALIPFKPNFKEAARIQKPQQQKQQQQQQQKKKQQQQQQW
jgi:hypothetical protein